MANKSSAKTAKQRLLERSLFYPFAFNIEQHHCFKGDTRSANFKLDISAFNVFFIILSVITIETGI